MKYPEDWDACRHCPGDEKLHHDEMNRCEVCSAWVCWMHTWKDLGGIAFCSTACQAKADETEPLPGLDLSKPICLNDVHASRELRNQMESEDEWTEDQLAAWRVEHGVQQC